MRELHAWHEAKHDARHATDATADSPAVHVRHSAKHEVLRDPVDRIAKHLEYRKSVEAAEATYAARHAKPEEARLERAAPEAGDKPASRIADRRVPPENQEQKQRRPERPRLPSDTTMQVALGVSVFASSLADAVNVLPGRWDAVAASFVGALVAGVAWGNKRWKDKHGNRPEG